jgi:hypothetical protein
MVNAASRELVTGAPFTVANLRRLAGRALRRYPQRSEYLGHAGGRKSLQGTGP